MVFGVVEIRSSVLRPLPPSFLRMYLISIIGFSVGFDIIGFISPFCFFAVYEVNLFVDGNAVIISACAF